MNETYKQQRTLVDGEIINESVVKIYNPFKFGKGYNLKYKSATIRNYLDIPLPDLFTDTEVGRTYRIAHLIYSDSNLIAKRIGNKIIPLSKQEIQEKLKLHRNTFNPYWRKVINNKVIKPVMIDDKEFLCFNPIYFNSTRYIPLYLFIAFQDELCEELPEWVIEEYLKMEDTQNDVSTKKKNSRT